MEGAGDECVAPGRESVDSMLVKLCLAIRGAIDSLVLVESTLTGLHSALALEASDPGWSSGSPEPDPVCSEEALDTGWSSGNPEPDPELELERRMARLKEETCVQWQQLQVSRKED